MNALAVIGRVVIRFLEHLGRVTFFTLTAVSHCVRPPIYPRLIGRQMINIGYYSLPVVGFNRDFFGHGAGSAKLYRLCALQCGKCYRQCGSVVP